MTLAYEKHDKLNTMEEVTGCPAGKRLMSVTLTYKKHDK